MTKALKNNIAISQKLSRKFNTYNANIAFP